MTAVRALTVALLLACVTAIPPGRCVGEARGGGRATRSQTAGEWRLFGLAYEDG